MIAQHEIAVRRHHKFRVGARVGILGGHVGFVERLAIHVDLPGIDADLSPAMPITRLM